MDALVGVLRASPSATAVDLVTAVLGTVSDEILVEKLGKDGAQARTVDVFRDSAQLGQQCVVHRRHFVKSLLVLARSSAADRAISNFGHLVTEAIWTEKIFASLIVLVCWEEMASRSPSVAMPRLKSFLELTSVAETPVLAALDSALEILRGQFAVAEALLCSSAVLTDDFDQGNEKYFGEFFDRAFPDFQETSILPALLNFSRLELVNEKFLQTLPVISPVRSRADTSPEKVRFLSDGNSPDGEIEPEIPLEATRSRDVAVYRGYRILLDVMACLFRDAAQRKMSSSSKRSSRVSLSRDMDLGDVENHELNEAESLLRNIFPLTFRVEILENAFALLFVRSNDLDENFSHEESFNPEETDTESIRSWSSAVKQIRDGFSCCSDILIRKILALLKNIVMLTNSQRLMEEQDHTQDQTFYTSVSRVDLAPRLSALLQKVSDALWRLDLVTFPKNMPLSVNPAYADDLMRPSFLTRKFETKKSSRTRRRSKRRRASSILKKHMDTSVVEKMLSSPASLLHISLHRGSFQLADQVLKIFEMDDAEWVREITFGQAFHEAVDRVADMKPGSKQKNTHVSVDNVEYLPLTPGSQLDQSHLGVLVATDTAVLKILADFSSCQTSVKSCAEKVTKLILKFPATKPTKGPDVRLYEDFVKLNLEMAISLDQKPPFTKALPFHPVAMQSFEALMDEISRRVLRLQQLLCDVPKPGNSGISMLKQLMKIVRSSLPASGLLAMMNGLTADPTTQRSNYLFCTYTFLKNFATALKLNPEVDNFELVYQSPYARLRKMLKDKAATDETEGLIKTLSLDLPSMLTSIAYEDSRRSPGSGHLLEEGVIILNDGSVEKSFTESGHPVALVAGTLVNLLKLFTELKENSYEPQKVSYHAVSKIVSPLSSLQNIQARDVLTEETRLPFYINLYNLMFFHANLHVLHHSNRESSTVWQKTDVATRFHFWRYRYHLGSMGVVSLQDLYDALSPLRQTSVSQNIQVSRRKSNGFVMANSEFVVNVGVLYPELLAVQVDLAVSDYLARAAWYDGNKNILHLPGWIFQVYPMDQLYGLVRQHWAPAKDIPNLDETIVEPSRRSVVERRQLRRDTSVIDTARLTSLPSFRRTLEAEDNLPVGRKVLRHTESDFPLDALVPLLTHSHAKLHSLLASSAVNNKILPATTSAKTLLKLLFASHQGNLSSDLLSAAFSETMRQGHDPMLLIEAPLIRFTVTSSPALKLLKDVVLALSVEKNLTMSPWNTAAQISDHELRIRTVLNVWKKWPLTYVVEFFEIVTVEDQRSLVTSLHIRVKNMETLIRSLGQDKTIWKEIFPQANVEAVLTQIPFRDVEKGVEANFKAFTAAVLRLDQTEALNAWLHQSEMAFLGTFEDELQIRGLVHMLDSRPPQVLAAYQLLIPMLSTCSFSRIEELLASITTPEGRLPVIRISLMSGRFGDSETTRLREKEVENLILRLMPDLLRKSVAHLEGKILLLIEQLIIWNKLDYLVDILKIQNLFDVISRRMFEDMLLDYAKKAVDVFTAPSSSSRSGSISSGMDKTGRKDSAVLQHNSGKAFVMPPFAPPKNQWTDDDDVANCMVCEEKFGLFNRKHHCRRCGRVVCAACSSTTIQVDIYGENPVRACDDCFDQTVSFSSSLRHSKSSAITFAAPRNRSNILVSPTQSLSPKLLRERLLSPTSTSDQRQWLLTTDETSNKRMRDEFFFAEAPDVGLCIGLLKLHSNPLLVGKELLKMGNDLSEWMGSHSDCGLEHATLLSIMRTLFFKAKLFLHQDKDNSDWIVVCDMYLNQLQLVETLLDAGATEIPSVKQLADLDTLRRVRDQLAQQERYALAIEISTKAGLDPSNVWYSWGKCLLKVGKFTEAQQKMSRCLKAPVDKNQNNPPSAASLEEIMEAIQDARMPRKRGFLGADSVIDLVLRGDILKPEAVDSTLLEYEKNKKMTECLRYQEMYGTHSSLLRFYVKEELVQKALEYCAREGVSVEIFTETVVMPHLRSGKLASLEDEMVMADPTLNKWSDYLIGVCKQLSKRNMNHVLLAFQLFMKDYLRAATTCIMFFQYGATTYATYFDRLHFLDEAQRHVTAYLESNTPPSSPVLPEDSGKFRMQKSFEEARKYLKAIQLQVIITHVLASKTGRLEERRNSISSAPPTLFGNAQAKVDVIAMLLELHNTPKVDDHILSILDTQGLNADDVITKAASQCSREGLKGILGVLMTMRKSHQLNDSQYDSLVIRMLSQCGSSSLAASSKEWEAFIKQISTDERKVDAFVKAKKLKSAYLLAVQMQRADLVGYVAQEATELGDTAVQNICNRWLETNKKRRP